MEAMNVNPEEIVELPDQEPKEQSPQKLNATVYYDANCGDNVAVEKFYDIHESPNSNGQIFIFEGRPASSSKAKLIFIPWDKIYKLVIEMEEEE